jgi:hypothetical protein
MELQPSPSQETTLVAEASPASTSLEKFSSQATMNRDETGLIHSLHKIDELLAGGEIKAAGHFVQDALEVVNLYRAKVLHAEGVEILKKAKNLRAQNSSTPKTLAREMDAILRQAYQRVQEALQLDYQQAQYRSTLLEIEQMQKARRIEDLYERAVDAQKRNHLPEAKQLFKEILDLDLHNEFIKNQYRTLLLIDFEKKNKEIQQKLKRKKNVKYDLMGIREILFKLKEIDALEPFMVDYLNQIETMLRH